MATVNKIPVNGSLPKNVIWNGRTVKQIWIDVPIAAKKDEERHLLYRNDEQFIFTQSLDGLDLSRLAENTLVFKGFSASAIKGNYLSVRSLDEAPKTPEGQMVVKGDK